MLIMSESLPLIILQCINTYSKSPPLKNDRILQPKSVVVFPLTYFYYYVFCFLFFDMYRCIKGPTFLTIQIMCYSLCHVIPSFRYRDNSVHLHECSPFWVGIFVTFNKENYHVYCFM